MSKCPIKLLPKYFPKLKKLEEISLEETNIYEIPDSLGD